MSNICFAGISSTLPTIIYHNGDFQAVVRTVVEDWCKYLSRVRRGKELHEIRMPANNMNDHPIERHSALTGGLNKGKHPGTIAAKHKFNKFRCDDRLRWPATHFFGVLSFIRGHCHIRTAAIDPCMIHPPYKIVSEAAIHNPGLVVHSDLMAQIQISQRDGPELCQPIFSPVGGIMTVLRTGGGYRCRMNGIGSTVERSASNGEVLGLREKSPGKSTANWVQGQRCWVGR
jgi:hypothetical protein